MASEGHAHDGVEPDHSSPDEPGTATWTELQASFGQPASEETVQAIKRTLGELEQHFGIKGPTKHLPSLPERD